MARSLAAGMTAIFECVLGIAVGALGALFVLVTLMLPGVGGRLVIVASFLPFALGVACSKPSAECLEGWWYRVSGPCDPLCGTPNPPPECSATDCESIEAQRYSADGTVTSLAALFLSEAMSSFSLVLSAQSDSWSIEPECQLTTTAGSLTFACVGSELVFSTARFDRPSSDLASAFDPAVSDGAPCQHSF